MFIGHFAVGLAAKKVAPRVSLGTLFLSVQFVDLLWPLLLLLGVEHARIEVGNTTTVPIDFYDYPFTHSLLMALVWSLLGGVAYYLIRREKRGALVVGFCVLSHWVLDLLTHRADLPLTFGSGVFFGLGLWNSVVWTVVVELSLFAAGVLVYLRSTRARDRTGVVGFWTLAAVLLLVHLANLFGPPPPTVQTVAIAGNATWLFVLWAYWVDRHRETATAKE
jgi:membrane-bound metal-dependent hydrolase YbcI (DUF457 family)